MEPTVQLTKDDFEEWQNSMVTQTIMEHMKKTILSLKSFRTNDLENMLGLTGNELFQKQQELVYDSGRISAWEEWLNLTFEDIS